MSVVNYMKIDTYEKPYVLIPLSDAALQFYKKKYGNGSTEIFGALNGPFSGVVELMAEKLPYRQHKVSKRLPHKKLTLLLPHELRFAKVMEQSVLSSSKLLESMFRGEFVSFVHGGVICGSSESGAVKSFMEEFGIDDDMWDFDCARVFYRRAMGYEK